MTSASLFRNSLGIVILIAPFIFGTSPRPAPYNEYRVTGEIVRPGGGPKENFVITLLGYSIYHHDTVFVLRSSNDSYYGVTDTSGRFVVDVIFEGIERIDSLTIRVSSANNQGFVSPVWFTSTGKTTLYGQEVFDEPGCSGCGTEVKRSTYIKGYMHTFQHQTVVIPD